MIPRPFLLVALLFVLPSIPVRTHAETGGNARGEKEDDTFLGMDAIVRDEEDRDYDESDIYHRPDPEALPFVPEEISLSDTQAALLVRALNAVACNYPSGPDEAQVSMGVKQMALALALRLDTHSEDARLAEHQLRRNRAPRPLAESEPRETLAAKLWNAGFGLQRYAKSDGDRHLGACLLDLAARFHPQDSEKLDAMARLDLPATDTRWQDVTEIPDLDALVARYAPVVPETSVPVIAEGPAPEPFAFRATRATLAVFAPVEGAPCPRLGVALVTDRSKLPGPVKKSGQPLGLDADLPGVAFTPEADLAMKDALARIDERLPEWRETGAFLHFTLATPFSPESESHLGPAAVILAQLLASGTPPDPALAVAGAFDQDGTLVAPNGLAEAITSTADPDIRLVAVPAEAEIFLGDFALVGKLEGLLARQFIACQTLDELLAIAPAQRPLGVATALESFAKIQELATRMSADEMIANSHIQDRLREIVAAVPGHLSARCLLAAGLGRPPSTLSLPGSITQLRTVEQPLNALIRQRLNPTPDAPAPDFAAASALFSKAEFDLRKLRPILHTDAHSFSDSLVDLIDDLRVQIRADAARSAVFLQQALDNLELKVAQFADDK